MTLVSVVIPFRGRADWLREAVESVLAQTLGDFEVIVVDDGSEQRPQFLDDVTDSRVRYVRQDHRGASAARNHGMRLATGRYVAFLDADDLFMPEKLEIQIGEMESHPEVAMTHTSYARVDAAGVFLEEVPSGTFTGDLYPRIVTACPITTPTVVIRLEVLERHGLAFDEAISIGEDVILWIEIARRFKIRGIDQFLTQVRIHGNNAYADPAAQYRGGVAILEHAFRSDASFGFMFRRRALAEACKNAGSLFLANGDETSALRCAVRSVGYWPFDRTNLRLLLVALLPRPIRTALKRVREGANVRAAR